MGKALAALLLLEPLDLLLGACRAMRAEGIRYRQAKGLVTARLFLLAIALVLIFCLS